MNGNLPCMKPKWWFKLSPDGWQDRILLGLECYLPQNRKKITSSTLLQSNGKCPSNQSDVKTLNIDRVKVQFNNKAWWRVNPAWQASTRNIEFHASSKWSFFFFSYKILHFLCERLNLRVQLSLAGPRMNLAKSRLNCIWVNLIPNKTQIAMPMPQPESKLCLRMILHTWVGGGRERFSMGYTQILFQLEFFPPLDWPFDIKNNNEYA